MTAWQAGDTISGMPMTYPPDTKRTAVALNQNGASTPTVASLLGIDPSTVYRWLQQFSVMDDSEREAFVRDKRKTCDCLWASIEETSLLRAMIEQLSGSAKDARDATVSAGVARDKNMMSAGAPKPVDNTSTNTPHPALLPDKPTPDSTE